MPNFTLRFFPKDVFLSLGGYDENLVVGEDVILKFKWLCRGLKMKRCKYVIAHFATEGIKSQFLKKYYYGKTFRDFQLEAKKVNLSLDREYTSTGLFYIRHLFRFKDYSARFAFGFLIVKFFENIGLLLGHFV